MPFYVGQAAIGDSTIGAQGAATPITINLDSIASTSTVYTVTVSKSVSLAYIPSATTLYAVSISKQVALGHIASTSVLYAPSVSKQISLGFIASGSIAYPVTVNKLVPIGYIASTSTVYDVTVTIVPIEIYVDSDHVFVTGVTSRSYKPQARSYTYVAMKRNFAYDASD